MFGQERCFSLFSFSWLRWLWLPVMVAGLVMVWRLQVTSGEEVSAGVVDVSLVAQEASVAVGEVVSYDLFAHPNGEQMSAATFGLRYDPTVLMASASEVFEPGEYLTQLLPNCYGGVETPCPMEVKVDEQAGLVLFNLAVPCTDETGCVASPTDGAYQLGTVRMVALTEGKTTVVVDRGVVEERVATQVAVIGQDSDAMGKVHDGGVSVSGCSLGYDVEPNGEVDVVDVTAVANNWNSGVGQDGFVTQYDFNADHGIDVIDVQTIANQWGTVCPE